MFKTPTVEEGYGLFVNSKNTVEQLSPEQIKQLFDGEISNWKTVGGPQNDIKLLRVDDIFAIYPESEMGENYELLPEKLKEQLVKEENAIGFFPLEFAPTGAAIKQLPTEHLNWKDYFFGKE